MADQIDFSKSLFKKDDLVRHEHLGRIGTVKRVGWNEEAGEFSYLYLPEFSFPTGERKGKFITTKIHDEKHQGALEHELRKAS